MVFSVDKTNFYEDRAGNRLVENMSEVEIPYMSRKRSDSNPDIFDVSEAWDVVREQISIKLQLATSPSTDDPRIAKLQKVVRVLDRFMSIEKGRVDHANTREREKIQIKSTATAVNLEAIRNIGFTVPEYCLIAEGLLHSGFTVERRVCKVWWLTEVIASVIHHGYGAERWGYDVSIHEKFRQLSREQAETLIKAMRFFWKITRLPAHGGNTNNEPIVADVRRSLIKVGLLDKESEANL